MSPGLNLAPGLSTVGERKAQIGKFALREKNLATLRDMHFGNDEAPHGCMAASPRPMLPLRRSSVSFSKAAAETSRVWSEC